MDINWPGEKLELLDREIVECLNSSGQTSHKVQVTVDKRGKHIISLMKNYDNTCSVLQLPGMLVPLRLFLVWH